MVNKIKSAEDVLDKYITYGEELDSPARVSVKGAIKAMHEYTQMIIEAQLEIAAEEATTKEEGDCGFNGWEPYWTVDQDSIRNCTRIKLD